MPRPSLGREAEHADLALVQVLVDLERCLARRRSSGYTAERIGWIAPLADEPVGVPRLAVVREVASDLIGLSFIQRWRLSYSIM